jgi:DNA-binding NtrC family response regulator
MGKGASLVPGLGRGSVQLRARILLAVEDPGDLRNYSAILFQGGFVVWPTSSYQEAAESVRKLDPDLVVVTQGSPAFEGRCVLESAIAADRHRPVLVLTRSVDMGCYLDAMQFGAVDYLEKPQLPAQIVDLVRKYLPPSEARPRAHVM